MAEELIRGLRSRLDARGVDQGFVVRLQASTTVGGPPALCALAVDGNSRGLPNFLLHARQPTSPCSSVRRLPEGEGFLVSPPLFPPELHKLWFFLYLPAGAPGARPPTLATLRPSRLEIARGPADRAPIGYHPFDSAGHHAYQTLQLLEIYQTANRDGWRMYFLSTGHQAAMEQIAAQFGFVAAAAEFAPAAAAPPPAPPTLPADLLRRPDPKGQPDLKGSPDGKARPPAVPPIVAPPDLRGAPDLRRPPVPPVIAPPVIAPIPPPFAAPPQPVLPPQPVALPPTPPPEARRPLFRPDPPEKYRPGAIRIGLARPGPIRVLVGAAGAAGDGVALDQGLVRVAPEGEGRRLIIEDLPAGASICVCLEEPA